MLGNCWGCVSHYLFTFSRTGAIFVCTLYKLFHTPKKHYQFVICLLMRCQPTSGCWTLAIVSVVVDCCNCVKWEKSLFGFPFFFLLHTSVLHLQITCCSSLVFKRRWSWYQKLNLVKLVLWFSWKRIHTHNKHKKKICLCYQTTIRSSEAVIFCNKVCKSNRFHSSNSFFKLSCTSYM